MSMRVELEDDGQLRGAVALLGIAEVTIHAVMPEYFLYSWPCDCKIVVDSTRREWHACTMHRPRTQPLS
jgi:hypothetical protein